MANLKELRTRIASVKNTQKITAAMSQIAAARLRKAQGAVLAARPYGERLVEVVQHLVAGVDPGDPRPAHPLLEQRPVERVGLVLVTADRGLCGGFNANANKAAARFIEAREDEGQQTVVIVVGKKGRSFLKHRGVTLTRSHDGLALESLVDLSKVVASELTAMFNPTEADTQLPRIDSAYLIYNHFVSVLTQDVHTDPILPITAGEDAEELAPGPSFEPSPAALLDHLLPVAVESALQQAFFNSIASEIAARRTAMDSATDNATELIGDLTLTYNRERQAAITTELMEIIGGAEALKG